ncbi:MAG: tRNA 2-thiocytidine(32) synthetase TtcA [Deltaproteobacteria bacterium]|nr:tRNA 2-thiocytidine(32) synthetase TtcA [Deltaproteobacteria bacterium]
MAAVIENGLFRVLRNRVGRAIQEFQLLEEGDRVLVALSGGKDSWTLLHVLDALRRRAPVRYELVAATIDPGFPGFDADAIAAHCTEAGFAFVCERTEMSEILRVKADPRKNPCALCARLRRGALYNLAERLGCTKIALGHHLDDVLETLLLNQFYGGTLGAMAPKLLSDDRRNTVIRPLVYVDEKQTASFARRNGFPLVACSCPATARPDGKRVRVKALVAALEREDRRIKRSLLRSLSNVQPRHLMDRRLWVD